MKKLILCLFLLISTNAKAACLVDWTQLEADLKDATRISEAMRIRSNFVQDLISCIAPLSDLARLTELEATLAGEEFFEKYRSELANFIIRHIESFTIVPGFMSYQNVVIYKLLPKMRTVEQNITLRHKLLRTVTNCLEFLALIEPWEHPVRPNLKTQLRKMKADQMYLFCQ